MKVTGFLQNALKLRQCILTQLSYKSFRISLTNHIGSISHHKTLIASGLHIDTNMHTYHIHYGQKHFLETRHALTCGQHTPGLISVSYNFKIKGSTNFVLLYLKYFLACNINSMS